MVYRFLLAVLFFSTVNQLFSQPLDTKTLDEYFESLESRNEAMGSISISKNGKIVYSKSIGYRFKHGKTEIAADRATNYRIWSITKLYTATMIMQLIEEGKLGLSTKLVQFFPQIPNAESITIKTMLQHKSGIHDFVQNDSEEDWDANITEPLSKEFMLNNIAEYAPDFQPNADFRYSNSNYLLLGYIIESLDRNAYGVSLANRISSRIGLTSTFFGVGALDSIENKAFTYKLAKDWIAVDEGAFSGLVPAGAGGIVSTTDDLNLFMHSLFSGKLVSNASLQNMLPREENYGLGMMRTAFQDMNTGYGHTGGYIASESSLFYYPEDSLSIAYATNGIVIRKEEILENIMKIYHNKTFGISMNRKLQALLIFGFGLLCFLILNRNLFICLDAERLVVLGCAAVVLFWAGSFIAGNLQHPYSFIEDGITELDAFYSTSGTLMSGVHFTVVCLLIPFIYGLHKCYKEREINTLPLYALPVIPL